jgi:hypothetical protein
MTRKDGFPYSEVWIGWSAKKQDYFGTPLNNQWQLLLATRIKTIPASYLGLP